MILERLRRKLRAGRVRESSAAAPTIAFDGQSIRCRDGDSLASCLARAQATVFRESRSGEPRGIYCAIGICNECLLVVDGEINVRACMTRVADGMVVRRQTWVGAAGEGPS